MHVLARNGTGVLNGKDPDLRTWQFGTQTPGGMTFEICCTGPDLPGAIATEVVLPSEIPRNPDWQGRYRLVVAPPLVVFDIRWTPGEPLRIMNFSRGEWEDQLLRLAQ